ncbi:hypothetical protein JQ628_12340 [Bradyrhizobium lablabi]|uniref:hypothetical protein n=1 Tax=Bradyrhizobium lablabi TaxID=722472 RepID=UPI001BAB675F|nr:hypothetical protein [Bradyrhizobium lablabi]MBR1122306.1 hypothetical protein [Bradyrhizobium lablabi]
MDREIKKVLDEILSSVKSLDARLSKLEAGTGRGDTGASVEEKKLSLKEFLIERGPSNGVQKTLAIGYFLENYDGASPFNAADLERGFRAAREPVPPNINDKANLCVKKGHFMEHSEKKDSLKAWLVTRTGEGIVEAGFG